MGRGGLSETHCSVEALSCAHTDKIQDEKTSNISFPYQSPVPQILK